jgi:hypothetical protein
MEYEIVIDMDEMKDFLYNSLIRKGFIPTEHEIEEISETLYDYMVSVGVITEEEI